jgi:hypothetical protein
MGLLAIGLLSAAILFSLGEMGFLTHALNLLFSFILTLVLVVVVWPRRWRKVSLWHLAAAGLLLILAALLGQGSEIWRLLGFAVVPMSLILVIRDEDPVKLDIALLVPTVVFFLLLFLAVRSWPHLWWLANTSATGFSGAVGKLIGQDYAFGATASGVWVIALAAAWGLSRLIWAEPRRPRDFGLFLLLLAAVMVVVQILLTPLAMMVQRGLPRLDFLLFNAQILYFLGALAPIAWYRRRTSGGHLRLSGLPSLKFLAPVFVAGALLGAGLTLLPGHGESGGLIVLLDRGYLNWDVPVFGAYGEQSGGMFGRLPGFLEAQGYEVIKVRGPLEPELLSGAGALVSINLMEFLEPDEKQLIWDYVARGGSLLILGDHTGVKGIRGPFNDILEPVNIGFEFDSATFWAQGWRDALDLISHPINKCVRVSEDVQIWVGASLAVAPPARPVIVGKYGYSDIGNAANIDKAYLGDRRHNPGEQIGDLCLVAGAPYGKGRVLVFGDTSPFQNLALVSSWTFVQRVFQWLTGAAGSSLMMPKAILLIGGVLVATLFWAGLARPTLGWLVMALGVALAAHVSGRLAEPPPLARVDLPKAVIDRSHGERFDELTWYEDCIGGLKLNLMRNGYCPMLMREFSGSLVGEGKILVVVAPAQAFSRSQLEVIEDFVNRGGILLLSTGYEEKDGSESLLSLFGARIRNVPLAHFETDALGQTVRFSEAWPLEVSGSDAVPICHHPDFPDPVVTFIPRGEGGALVIGDSTFLLNSNLEGLKVWHVGNIMFLRELFERLKAGEIGS